MLNIRFARTSAPITDAELLSVIDGVRPAIADPAHPDKDYALLLARMVLRIQMGQPSSGDTQLVPVQPTPDLLYPFIDCPEDELALAWSAMILIAAQQQKHRTREHQYERSIA